ncbi:MAG: hypothetical protein R2762_13565 [Bryobacteraceae bacterium]
MREFSVGPDPYGATWKVRFVWLQNAISIRHADAVDCKFAVDDGFSGVREIVISLSHPMLREMHRRLGRPLTDSWCMQLASAHLAHMIRSGEDIEKTLVAVSGEDLERANAAVEAKGRAVVAG